MSGTCIRKPVHELAPEDLDRFPVWEYALDEEELSTPWKDFANADLSVAIQIRCRDGRQTSRGENCRIRSP